MFKVNIYIETTWKGPARRPGAAMWLVEYETKTGIPVTREGLVWLEDGTENQGALTALAEALEILTKSCSARIFTRCEHILCSTGNFWHIQWEKNAWHNARGKEVKNADLWQRVTEAMKHHACTFCKEDHSYRQVMELTLRKEMGKHE